MAGELQLAREQVRVDLLCVRIIERLVPTGQEVVDLVNLVARQSPHILLRGMSP